MRKHIAIAAALASAATFGFATPASAQATRTWVSGVGDDVNPCSRTAPCKTFAGAISKTAAGGEINCLDPGGFGAVSIIKSMTINCIYTEGGVLAGGNGITVNMPATTDVTFLRGLDIFGVNPPTHGIRFINNGTLHVEDCTIRRFNAANSFGISAQPSGQAKMTIINTTIAENGNGATGGGILIQPTGAGGSLFTDMINVRVQGNANVGLKIDMGGNTSPTGSTTFIKDSQFSNSPTGMQLIHNAGNSLAVALVQNSVFNHNTTVGMNASGTGAGVIRVDGSVLTGNTLAVSFSGGGTVRSYGNNIVDGNGGGTTFSGAVLQKF